MKIINRSDFLAEQLIREHVRKRIYSKVTQQNLEEQKLRRIVRMLLEIEAGTEEPSEFTGINVLASVLERIIPVLQDDYKMLTTSSEQRESFRNHIIHAIKNSLSAIESSTEAEKLPESFEFEIDKSLLREKMKIDLDSEDDMADPETVEGEFIDIEGGEEEDFVQIDDQNETGRNFASATYKKIEKQIVDAYDMLADEEDQKLFYDYLLTNLLLYFDKFEDELQPTLPDTTTPEYEKEKAEGEAEEGRATDAIGDEEDLDTEEDLV